MTSAADCPSSDALGAYAEGALDEVARAALATHVRGCADCSAVVDAILAATALSDGAGKPSDEAIRAALLAEGDRLAPGARVGRYEILSWLGAGGMGTVYAAHDPALDRRVALKLIRAQVAGPELEARLLREAKAMARLSHPEVIAVYDAGRDGERLFIAMELVDGGTLRQWLAEKPRTWREILAAYVKAGRGLEQAHASGLVHRDFKPDNVLVGNDGRVRVTDFGLARGLKGDAPESTRDLSAGEGAIEATLTRTGALVGTPLYMAPEQFAGTQADARTDVYAFCVALYEALYGERPFNGDTLAALRAAKSAAAVRPVTSKRHVPQGLRRALLVGMRARPEDRFRSMGELLDALARAARWQRAPLVAGGAALAVGAIALAVRASHPAAHAGAPLAAAPPECTTHRACVEAHGGAPYVCRASDQRCVPITSDDCTPMFEPQDLVSEDTVWLGAMFPMKGQAPVDVGPMHLHGADFARREIAQATRSLDGVNASMRVRRIALVGCDDTADPMRAAKHLVNDVGVPAILGFGSGQEIVDVAGAFLIERGVVSVASLTSSPLITRLPQPQERPRMVWRTTYSLDLVAEAIGKMIEDVLEPAAKVPTTRIALARLDMAAPLSFAEALYRHLRFNGKGAQANGTNYREVTLPTGAIPIEQIAPLADRIAEGAPTFVVLLGPTATVLPLMEAVERHALRPKPTYVVALESATVLSSFFARDPERRRRLYTVDSVSDSLGNGRFVIRYNEQHAEKVTITNNPGASYDAFYLLADAVFAAGRDPITGRALANAFARLVVPGHAIEVGPPQVLEAISELSSGRSLDLDGVTGGLDFDLATGEPPSDIELLCAGIDANGRPSGEDVPSGVVYRAATRTIEGALRCP